MFDRLGDMPAYRVMEGKVPASRFKLLRLAVLRLGNPLRLPLRAFRSLQMYLDEDSWTVVDTALNDFPIVSWTHFHSRGRSNLHQPVACRITQLHAHAGLITESAFHDAISQIEERL